MYVVCHVHVWSGCSRLLWSQWCPTGEWCFKANTLYTNTMPVITIAVINETLKAALQGHLLPCRLIKGLSLTRRKHAWRGYKRKRQKERGKRERKSKKRVQFDGLTARFKKIPPSYKTFNQALIEKPFSHGHNVKAVVRSVSGPSEAAE